MAVRQSHWSCNGSTSQLPYCTTKSITTPALLPTPSFRHREPAAASRTFTLLVLANTHVDDRRLSLVTSIGGVKNSLGRKLEGQISPALLIKLTHQSKFLAISPTLRLNVVFPPLLSRSMADLRERTYDPPRLRHAKSGLGNKEPEENDRFLFPASRTRRWLAN